MTNLVEIPLIQTEYLSKSYGHAKDVDAVYALRDVDLTIQQGEFLSIMGPSGSGKSTLMNVLGLLDERSAGVLRFLGEDSGAWDEARKSHFRNREMGFIFQAHMLLPELSALENVLIPLRIAGLDLDVGGQRAKDLLARIGLGDRMHHRPNQLSGGQNQRVAIARALINAPKLVFADEPTGALDYQTSLAVYNLMRDFHREQRITFVIVTHEREFAARTDRIITLLDGRIQSDEAQLHSAP